MEIATLQSDTLLGKQYAYKKSNTLQTNKMEYGLTQQIFDPSKSSPPKNEFLIKLFRRMNDYESCCETKDISFIKK
jgi:hypothetical protein